MINWEKYRDWFFNHVQSYNFSNTETQQAWEVKIEHGVRVSENCWDITKYLQLQDDDMQLARHIGLFHDIGRFRQIVNFNTFSDTKSIDHGKLGIDVIREEKLFSEMSDDFQCIINQAIYNHNKAVISPSLNEKERLFSQILRDADKLDILRLVTEYYLHPDQKRNGIIELDLPDKEGVSPDVCHEILQRKMVKRSSLETADDFKVLQISWIYDIHYRITFQKILESQYLEKLRSVLPDTSEVDRVYQQVSSDLMQKMER